VRDKHKEFFFVIGSEDVDVYWIGGDKIVINISKNAKFVKKEQPNQNIRVEYR
jgi:hypothetical protein